MPNLGERDAATVIVETEYQFQHLIAIAIPADLRISSLMHFKAHDLG